MKTEIIIRLNDEQMCEALETYVREKIFKGLSENFKVCNVNQHSSEECFEMILDEISPTTTPVR